MEQLFNMLFGIYPMSEGLIHYLTRTLKLFEMDAKDYILKRGQICDRIYFVEKGMVRCYYEDKEGKQTTKWFMDEGNVIVAVDSFFGREPSYESIQALEDCVLYGITYDELEAAYRRFIEFNFHGRVLTTKYYRLSEKRVDMFQRLDALERYEFTKKLQPGVVSRPSVRDTYLASYLGMTRETLSRLRD